MKLIERNIKIDYFYRFISNMNITSAIWVLYLSYKGLSLVEIGILESIFHGTSLIFEVPTGAIADLMGRKKTLVVGRLISTISAILMLISSSFWGFASSFVFSALSYNLNSGSEEALIYDSLKVLNREDEYTKINCNLNFIIEIAQAVAVFLGGMLSEISFSLSYILGAIISLGAFGISLGFYEVILEEEKHQVISFKAHFKQCFITIRRNKKFTQIMLFFSVIFTIGTTTFFFSQKYFSSFGYSKAQISIIFAVNGLLCAFGAKVAYAVENKLGRKGIISLLPMLIAVSLVGMALSNRLTVIGFFFMNSFITAMLYPIESNYVNELIPSRERATLLSVESMCFSIMMLIFFPLIGFIGDRISLGVGFLILSASTIVLTVMYNVTLYSLYKDKQEELL